jgi:hypothetical protein
MSPKLGMGLYIVLTPALLSSCFTCSDMPFMYGIQDNPLISGSSLVLENDLLELVWKMNFSGYPLSFNSCTTRSFSCCFLLSVEGMLSAQSSKVLTTARLL